MPLIEVRNLTKSYKNGELEVPVLMGINLEIEAGEFVALMGPSGAGKSTFMNIIGCLDRPTGGEYYLDGEDVSQLSDNRLAEVRNQKMGFVFQSFNLLARTTAVRNVELPMLYAGRSDREARARWALERVGLADRMHHKPNELSGGQQQRVAIARALMMEPTVLLADEPTGNLDSQTGSGVMTLFKSFHDGGQTIVLVTHDAKIASVADRVLFMRDGQIVRETSLEGLDDPFMISRLIELEA